MANTNTFFNKNCYICNKIHSEKVSNLKRGWGLCCDKACAGSLRELKLFISTDMTKKEENIAHESIQFMIKNLKNRSHDTIVYIDSFNKNKKTFPKEIYKIAKDDVTKVYLKLKYGDLVGE